MVKAHESFGHVDDPLNRGMGSQINAAGAAHKQFTIDQRRCNVEHAFQDIEMYLEPGTGMPTIHMLCPKCEQGLKIDGREKSVSFDDSSISFERVQCTWESPDQLGRQDFGMNLCRFSFTVDNNLLRET
jgi:hypothetical protein